MATHLVAFYTATAGVNGPNLGSDEEDIVLIQYLIWDINGGKVLTEQQYIVRPDGADINENLLSEQCRKDYGLTEDQVKNGQTLDSVIDSDIDSEDLIAAVKNHPVIWDCGREEYKDRNKKCQAWQAVGSGLFTNFEDKDSKEKNEIAKQLQAKWRYIKDAYMKSKRKEKNVKSGSSSKSSKPYVYSKSLEFLESLQVQRELHESLPSGNPECSGTRSEVMQHELQPQKKKSKNSQVEDELIKFMRQQSKQPEEDADRQFLLSMLPDMKAMNEGQKRKLKMQMLQAIDDIRNTSTLYGTQEHVGYGSYGYHHGTPTNYNVQSQNNNIPSYNTIQYSQGYQSTTASVSSERQVGSPDSVDSTFSIC